MMAENAFAPGYRRRGLLQINTELQSRGSVDRTGIAGGLNDVAYGFAQIGGEIGKIADHAAAVEGNEAGRLAGLDPEFRPTKSLTIRGEAYDKAGLAIYGARTKERFAADLDAIYDKHGEDPQGLAAALDAKRSTWLAESLPEVRPDLEIMFDKTRFQFMRQAARAQASRIAGEQKAALESEIALGVKQLQQRAYWLGLDPAADEALASDVSALTRTLSRTGVDGKPLVSPAAAAAAIKKAQGEANDARLIGAYERQPTAEAKAAFIEKFREDYGKSEGLAKSYSFDDFERLTGKMETGLSREVTARNTALRAVREDISSLAKRAEKGFPAPPEEMAAIEARVATAGDPDTAASFAEAKGLLELQETARSWTPAQLDAVIAQGRATMEKGGASEPQIARFTLLQELEGEMRKELKADPLGWADRTGVLPVTPLDFSTPEKTAATLKSRIAEAEEVGARYGQDPVYLRPDEKRQLATVAAQGGEQTLMLSAAIAGAGAEKAPRMLKEIFDEAPAVAMMGGLVAATGVTPAARDAADGFALMKTEGFQGIAPAKAEARRQAVEVIGDALTDMPKSEGAAVTLANAIYEVRARRQGLTEFDGDVWKAGLREALGERTIGGATYGGIVRQAWWSGQAILLPADMRQDTWRETIDMLTREDLDAAGLGAPIGEDGRAVSMERLKAATLLQAGDGRYALATGDPKAPGAEGLVRARDAKGSLRTFELDFKKLAPILRRRRPDLFLGGA